MVEMRMRDALREKPAKQMIRDDRVFLMGEDIAGYGGSYAVTKGLEEEFGEDRVRDTPISESVIVGAGVGAAVGGLRPMVEIMTINFSFVAFDQIINSASKLHHMSNGQMTVPLVIRMAAGAGSWRHPQPQPRGPLRTLPRAQGGHAIQSGRWERLAQAGVPRRQPDRSTSTRRLQP